MSDTLTQSVQNSADLRGGDPRSLVGEARVQWVQRRLLELGYTDGGPVDGSLNLKTQGTILDFRNRNGLPLTNEIDDTLIWWLIKGPTIELPVSQVTAETPQIAEKVQAVKEVWYARFWAKVLGWPSLTGTVILGILDQFGNAVNALAPVKGFVTEHLTKVDPIVLAGGMFTATTIIAFILWRKSANAEAALVSGFRSGTVKNDVDAAKEVGP